MQCISCGKDIPSIAKVCPYCHRDTKESSEAHGIMCVLSLLGGIVGYFFNGWGGAIIGAALIGGIGGVIVYLRIQSRFSSQPAKVELVKNSALGVRAPATPQVSAEKYVEKSLAEEHGKESMQARRLATLDELKVKGLISVDEYNMKRKQIIDNL